MLQQRALRVPLAFLVMPLVPYVMLGHVFGNPLPVFALVATYIFALALGIPTYLLLKYLYRFSMLNAVLSGSLILALLTFVRVTRSYAMLTQMRLRDMTLVEDGTITPEGWGTILGYTSIVAVIGAITGFVFWLVAEWGIRDQGPRASAE